jgi:hypothetical protein
VAEKLIPLHGDEKGCCGILFYCPQIASAPIWTQQSQKRIEDYLRPKDGYTTR